MKPKKVLEGIIAEIAKSNWKLVFSLFILCLLFNDLLEFFIKSFFINKIFIFFKSVWYVDVIVIIISLLFIFFSFRWRNKIKISTNFFIVSFLAFILFAIYRVKGTHWEYLPFSFSNKIKYLDVVFIYFPLTLVWLKQFFRLPAKFQKPFFIEDKPIQNNNEQDDLNFKNYAKQISQKVSVGSYKGSFAIGINGTWGSGKSSLMNLILDNFDKEENVIIEFNPWLSQNPQSLIKDFFELVNNNIKQFDKEIGKFTALYANKLIASDETTFMSNVLNYGEFKPEYSLEELQNNIDESLKKINKKIIITIDDIDRLNTEEVIEVLKLVRNTANFSNTVFFLLYDRNYISKAIDQINSNNSDFYMEKIVQLEINLPVYEKEILKKILSDRLKIHLPKIDFKDIDHLISNSFSRSDYITDWVKNIRDINRLINSINLNFSMLEQEVVFEEFFCLEIMRLKLPTVYELLKHYPNKYLKPTEHNYERNLLKLRHENDNDKGKLLIINEIEQRSKHLDLEDVEKFLGFIFPIGHINYSSRNRLSIVYKSNFNRYFRYSLSTNELSEIEFSLARKNGIDAMKAKIDFWTSRNLFGEIRYRFKEIEFTDFKTDDYYLIIESILYFANKAGSYKDITGYDMYDLISKLNLQTKNDQDHYIEYFNDIINRVKNSSSYELVFLNSIISERDLELIFKEEQLISLLVNKIKDVSLLISKIDKQFWDLYHLCFIKKWTKTSGNTYTSEKVMLPNLQGVLLRVMQRMELDDVIEVVIKHDHRSIDSGHKQINEELMIQIWIDKNAFRSFFSQTTRKSKYLNEFLEFFDKCEEVDFKKFIDFPFKVIPEKE